MILSLHLFYVPAKAKIIRSIWGDAEIICMKPA
jgi:hypothetical protein